MYPIPGHLAMSLAGSRLMRLPYTPAIVATFAVDVLDKVFADILVIAPYGRCWFHTLLSVAVCSILIGKFTKKEWGFSWMLGHLLHLVGDIGFIPWFYPFIPYHWPDSPNMVAATLQGVKETVTGMHYSEPVLKIFVGQLMLIELFLLAAASGMLLPSSRTKILRAVSLALFCIFLAFRLLYDFPPALDTMSHLIGDWIRL